MNREAMLKSLDAESAPWDVLIIGGGATGLGAAVDAAARGLRTLLLEQADFAKGTSSRSTKLVHGGVRYLKQGNLTLVLEALHERGLLLANAPHLVHRLPFVVPNYGWFDQAFYGVGLKIYDLLALRYRFGRSQMLSKQQTLERLPTIEMQHLVGGVLYYDGQFDDARLAINLAQTAADLGATVLNYFPVTGLLKTNNRVTGVRARDAETGQEFELSARVVINATGVFADAVRRFDDPDARPLVAPSQGAHLVLDRSFLPGDSALMVPKTDDGRVLFAIPWLDRVVIGTTDVPQTAAVLEPRPLREEVDFLLRHAARYLTRDPAPADILSIYAGLRPLVSNAKSHGATSKLSRDHTILVAPSGLITITGGKWTTYRRMAEDVINRAVETASLAAPPSRTAQLHLHSYDPDTPPHDPLREYGADAAGIRRFSESDPSAAAPLHSQLPITAAEVRWAARHEMARTVEDVLARRSRSLLLDARAAQAVAPAVADLLAEELGRDAAWRAAQVAAFQELARGYTIDSIG